MVEFRDPYREALEEGQREPRTTVRAPHWLIPIWIVAFAVQIVVGASLSFDAWAGLLNGQALFGFWTSAHPLWVVIGGFAAGVVGGAVAMRPCIAGGLAYFVVAALPMLSLLLMLDFGRLSVGAFGVVASPLGAAVGFRLLGFRLPRVIVDGDRCAECGYSLRGLAANSPCPECGRQLEPARRSAEG